MNVQMFVMPRQMGKTTAVAKRFAECADGETVLIVANKAEKQEIMSKDSRLKKYDRWILYATSFDIRGMNVKNVIIDEWLHFSEKQKWEIYGELVMRSQFIENVAIYSTPNRLYDKGVLEKYRFESANGGEPYPLPEKEKEIAYNFLGNVSTEIFNITREPSALDDKTLKLKELMSEESYKMQILGHLFI